MWLGIWTELKYWFWVVLIKITTGLFSVINLVYRIFLVLVSFNMFDQNDYNNFATKIYALLGIVVLFVVAYNLLSYIVSPDKNKGGKSVESMLKTLFTSLLLIVACPFLFSLSVRIQEVVLKGDGIIYNFFDSNTGADSASGDNGALYMEFSTFASFFYGYNVNDLDLAINHSEGLCVSAGSKISDYGKVDSCTSIVDLADYDEDGIWKSGCINEEGDPVSIDCQDGWCSLYEAKHYAMSCDDYTPYNWFSSAIATDYLDFKFLLCIAAGVYLVYVMVSFCFDIAARSLKLFFYEILSPICIASRIIPTKEVIFKTWWTALRDCYLSVFIRVLIMRFGTWVISKYGDSTNVLAGIADSTDNVFVSGMARVFIILGVVTFIKEAPGLLCKLLGIEDVSIGGIGGKIKDALHTVAPLAATAGALGLGSIQGAADGFRNIRKAEGWKNKLAAGARGFGSMVGGGLSSAARTAAGYTNNFGMHDVWDEIKGTGSSIISATDAAAQSRRDREDRRDQKDNKAKWKEYSEKFKSVMRLDVEIGKCDSKLTSVQSEIAELNSKLDAGEVLSDRERSKLATLEAKRDELIAHKSDLESRRDEAQIARDEYYEANAAAIEAYMPYAQDREKRIKAVKDGALHLLTGSGGVDEIRAEEVLDKYNGELDSAISTFLSKYRDQMTVSMESALDKSNFFSSDEGLKRKLLEFTDGKSIQQIDSINSAFSMSRNASDFASALGMREINGALDLDIGSKSINDIASSLGIDTSLPTADVVSQLRSFGINAAMDPTSSRMVCSFDDGGYKYAAKLMEQQGITGISEDMLRANAASFGLSVDGDGRLSGSSFSISGEQQLSISMGVTAENFADYKQAFSDTVSGAYSKAIKGAIADGLDSVEAASDLFINSADAAKAFSSIAGKDVRLAVDNVTTVIEETNIVGALKHTKEFTDEGITDIPKDSKGRKKLFDAIDARKNVRAKSEKAKQIRFDISSTSSSGGDSGKKK